MIGFTVRELTLAIAIVAAFVISFIHCRALY
jgi:hypothetical protein